MNFDSAQRIALRDAIKTAGINADLVADNGAIDATGYDEFVLDADVRHKINRKDDSFAATSRREWPTPELEGLAAEYARSRA